MKKRRIGKFYRYFLPVFSFLPAIFSSHDAHAAQPSLKPPPADEALLKPSFDGLDSSFWKRFHIFREKEATWKREKANDFASQVGFELPSLDFSDEYPLLVFQVMPLLGKGIGQQAVLFLNRGDFQSTGSVPIRVWFDSGESIGFSRVKWANRPVFALLSDASESDKISAMIQRGDIPVLISQGKPALRLRYRETLEGNQTLLWYQKISNPRINTGLQKHIQSKMAELEKKRLREAKKARHQDNEKH